MSEIFKPAQYIIGYTNEGLVNHIGISPGTAELSIQGRPM